MFTKPRLEPGGHDKNWLKRKYLVYVWPCADGGDMRWGLLGGGQWRDICAHLIMYFFGGQ